MNIVLQLLHVRLMRLDQDINPQEPPVDGETAGNPSSFPYVSLSLANIAPDMQFQFDPQCVIVFSPAKQPMHLKCNNNFVSEMVASLFSLQPLQDLHAYCNDEYFSKTYNGVKLVTRRDDSQLQISVRHSYVGKRNTYWLQITYLRQGVINMLALNEYTWGLIQNPISGTVYLPMWIKTFLQL